MRKRNIKEELSKYPCYLFENGKLKRITPPTQWNGLHLHHFIRTQWQQNNPEKFEQVEHLQKLIFLPPQMHMELHARHRRFKEKYGIEIDELLFNWRNFDVISAKKAREKTEINSLAIMREDIEKLINKAISKGNRACFITGQIPKVIQDEVKEAGYDIELCPTGMKIVW